MRLNGDRIYLREVQYSDLTSTYVDWLNDPEVNRFLETRFEVQSLQSITNYFQAHICKQNEPWWAICIVGHYMDKEARHIGNIKLGPINWYHRRADISLFIGDKTKWGNGYGTEAIKLVRDYAFNVLNLNKICAGIYESNKASIRAFEKADFQQEGILIDHVWNNGYENLILMGRTRFDS